jgi:hypothetical protein
MAKIIDSVKKFITFDDNELVQVNSIINDRPLKIISFLGDARIGKSTLMNCYLSHLLNSNHKLFNTTVIANKHCTTGIDMLSIDMPDYTIILLDVQGLGLYGSQDDCKIMLFIFMISNLIIYNQKDILKDNILSSFQSLTSIVQHIKDNKNKPTLLFRPIDINPDSEYDPNDNLDKLLSDSIVDQYSNTRRSIKSLFTEIYCKPTYIFDRKERKSLDNSNYLDFFLDTSNGFKDICIYIELLLPDIPSHSNIQLEILIEDINHNQKIDYMIFDTTRLQAENAIQNWLLTELNTYIYESIEVDGTEQNYLTCIKLRIDNLKIVLDEFDNKFKLITPEIYQKYRSELEDKVNHIIMTAINRSEQIATTELDLIYKPLYLVLSEFEFEFELDMDLIPIIYQIHKSFRIQIESTPYIITIKNKFIYQIDQDSLYMDDILTEIYDDLSTRIKSHIQTVTLELDMYIATIEYQLLNVEIFNIKKTFESIVDCLTSSMYEQFNDKSQYLIPNIEISNFNIKLLSNRILKLDNHLIKQLIIKNINSTETNIFKYCREYLNKLEPTFIEQRKINLSKSLADIQNQYMIKEEVPYTYKDTLQSYNKSIKLYNDLIDVGNDVYILNLDTYIKQLKNDANKDMKITKYTYLINHNNLHLIYTKSDFESKYNDIIKMYEKTHDNKNVGYYIQKEIVNTLFNKILNY